MTCGYCGDEHTDDADHPLITYVPERRLWMTERNEAGVVWGGTTAAECFAHWKDEQ
jgi:hypothetical protein